MGVSLLRGTNKVQKPFILTPFFVQRFLINIAIIEDNFMKNFTIVIYIFLISVGYSQTGTTIDKRDNKIYKTITISSQTWMAENLNVSIFRNGDPIPQARTISEWFKANENEEPAWCYYDVTDLYYYSQGTNYAKECGKLYNFYAVNDPRGLAPEGFHIPTNMEWTTLTDYLGKEDAGDKMKSKESWGRKNNGSNSSGFSGNPCGLRYHSGSFDNISNYCIWWSINVIPFEGEHAMDYNWFYSRYPIYVWSHGLGEFGYFKTQNTMKDGLSVRCIMDY